MVDRQLLGVGKVGKYMYSIVIPCYKSAETIQTVIEETGKEMAYLYTIARNLCMDEFRKKPVLNIDDYSDLPAGKAGEPESITDGIAIEGALEYLPEDLREIVVMRYVSGMSAANIGKVVGLSRFSVNRRLKEGLAALRKIMEGGSNHDR